MTAPSRAAAMDELAAGEAERGFLVLSRSMRLLYRDQQSWKLCGLINRIQQGKAADGVIPHAVLRICGDIAAVLKTVEHIKDLDELQAKQVIGDRDTQVLVVATGMPDPEDPNQSQILVILEEISRRPEPMLQDAKKRFRLTDKELLVIQHLLKGWTNKEIANQVGVTEQTIKEHIKNIMKKTKTVTRTGILLAVSGIDLSEQTSR